MRSNAYSMSFEVTSRSSGGRVLHACLRMRERVREAIARRPSARLDQVEAWACCPPLRAGRGCSCTARASALVLEDRPARCRSTHRSDRSSSSRPNVCVSVRIVPPLVEPPPPELDGAVAAPATCGGDQAKGRPGSRATMIVRRSRHVPLPSLDAVPVLDVRTLCDAADCALVSPCRRLIDAAPRVQGISQRIAHEVEGQGGHHEHHPAGNTASTRRAVQLTPDGVVDHPPHEGVPGGIPTAR